MEHETKQKFNVCMKAGVYVPNLEAPVLFLPHQLPECLLLPEPSNPRGFRNCWVDFPVEPWQPIYTIAFHPTSIHATERYLYFFFLSKSAPMPYSHGAATITILAEMDHKTMSSCKEVVVISSRNVIWWFRSSRMFHL